MEEKEHVQVTFFTKQTQFSISDAPYSIPSSSGSQELNGIVQSVLNEGSSDTAVDFDFLIEGVFLRTSLEEYLSDNNLTLEKILEIEYVERAAAPRPETSLAHDDWVSCVKGSNNLILCSCYDNTLRLWTREEKCLTTIPGHSGPVKCVAWLNNNDGKDKPCSFASGSHDQTMFVWRYHEASNNVECVFACKGHAGSVDCLAVNEDGERIVSGSWDKMIKLWSTVDSNDIAEKEEESLKKKLKSDGEKVTLKVPLITLAGHKEAVSAVQWINDSTVCSASWDHTLRLWDMTTSQPSVVSESSKAFFSISHSPLSNTIVSASADRHVRLHDLRVKEMVGTYTSHTAWVSSVDWSKTNEYLFLSGSHDMLMKLWDTRSPKAPLYNLVGQEDKILSVDWSIADLLLSGGADNQLKIFKYT